MVRVVQKEPAEESREGIERQDEAIGKHMADSVNRAMHQAEEATVAAGSATEEQVNEEEPEEENAVKLAQLAMLAADKQVAENELRLEHSAEEAQRRVEEAMKLVDQAMLAAH